MNMELLPQYELLQQERIADIHSEGYLLRHKKSGARILALLNEDDNKVFSIGFKTIPTDSTGVAHIAEHSVLCGSRKFPVKDPFVELAKGSLNTFLNAMTYPDKTVYPVASCNDTDFCNLMDVYLDAVFYPNIYQKEEIFRQEGWSYQLEEPDGEITINGVVYNEMKGAYSSPEDVLEREILNSLFLNNVYSVESGGDPADIPNLTWEDFLAFHQKYYHPSNSYIYFYGNMDLAERLSWLDKEYLSAFDQKPVTAGIEAQKPFEQLRRVHHSYPIAETDPLTDSTYLAWNAVIGTSLDVELAHAFAVLEYALLSAPGARLKQALLDAGIGNDIMGDYGSDVYQPYFSIIAKNANEEDAERFLQVIRDTLTDIIKEGIDRKALYAGINSMEFKFREADYGTFPKGLMYGLDVFDSWLYDDNAPFCYLKQLDVYAALKERVDTGYFEKLAEKYLLDNTHESLVILTPERGLTAKTDAALKERLQELKASLSDMQIAEMIERTKRLHAFQETPSPAEDLAKIPLLERADIGRQAAGFYNTEHEWDGITVLQHDVFTNGIAYLDLLFDVSCVAPEDIGYLGILKAVLGMVDTEHFSYRDLNNDINMNTGGISAGLSLFQLPEADTDTGDAQDTAKKPDGTAAGTCIGGDMRAFAGIRSRVLYDKLPYALKMSQEILTSRFEDDKRLYEIIAKLESRLSVQLASAGHQAAAGRALSYLSLLSAFNDAISGVAFYELVAELEKDFEEHKEALKAKLRTLCSQIFRRENLFVSVTADEDGMQALRQPLAEFAAGLPAGTENAAATEPACADGCARPENPLALSKKNEGFTTPGQVQYVARAGNFARAGFAYTGTLRILKVLMSYGYLWENVRVRGGAYGCMCAFGRRGDSYFVSYRDPHLRGTNEIFEGIPAYLESFDADEREMTKYIIGAISELDTPLTPSAKGRISLNAYFSGITEAQVQKERDEILCAAPGQLRALAPLVQAILDDGVICVVGNEEKIKAAGELFGSVRSLS